MASDLHLSESSESACMVSLGTEASEGSPPRQALISAAEAEPGGSSE